MAVRLDAAAVDAAVPIGGGVLRDCSSAETGERGAPEAMEEEKEVCGSGSEEARVRMRMEVMASVETRKPAYQGGP